MPVADHGPLSALPLAEYRPYSRLRLPQTTVTHASVPAVDAHAHLGRWLTGERWAVPDVAAFVGLMDSCHVSAVVNLDGRWGDELEENLDRYDRSHPGRFATSATSTGTCCGNRALRRGWPRACNGRWRRAPAA